ncbi:hypothetical protein HYH03_006350 [Edaphochlamys debaryana]|uniref:Protein kinase domain-containing protein n=1 Tax=Edaphochlamys debaryana TaxID=47281 RepID=A0A836C068_9CHLO|nr:hypothetical protein HYH03_006350 [Edaphochlamys debaryana]|eukprot:KAG2495400.1 hypothetical protein HYH03_006350 [Edaphochlamys debaryana]
MDILQSSEPGTKGAAALLKDATALFSVCLPPDLFATKMRTALRPPDRPGPQLVSTSVPNPPDCSNSTDASPLARCLDRRRIDDMALIGTDVGSADGVARPNNYDVLVYNVTELCLAVVTDDCIRDLGPVGCIMQALRGANMDPRSPPPPSVLGPEALASGVLQAPVGGGPPSVHLVVVIVPTGAVAAVLLLTARRRRRRRGQQQQLPDKAAAAAGPGSDLVNPDALTTLGGSCGITVHKGQARGAGSEDAQLETLGSTDSVHLELPGPTAVAPKRFSNASHSLWDGPITMRTPASRLNLHVAVAAHSELTPAAKPVHLSVDANASDGAAEDDVVQLLPGFLGQGAYGVVQEGLFRGQRVAVKQLTVLGGHPTPAPLPAAHLGASSVEDDGAAPKEPPAPDDAAASDDFAQWSEVLVKSFNQELKVLARCNACPQIVRILAACVTPPRLCLVMEKMDSSLDQLVHGPSGRGRGGGACRSAGLIPLPLVLHIAVEVARGLEFLHPTVVHRDLKPANVLLSGLDSARPVVKIGDLGLARIQETVCMTQTPEAGTAAYVAPECYDTENYYVTHKADIYAFGVLLWELLSGELPWYQMQPCQIAMQVCLLRQRLPVPSLNGRFERWHPKLRRVVLACFDVEPARRPAASDLVKLLLLIEEAFNTMGWPSEPAAGAAAHVLGIATQPVAAAAEPQPLAAAVPVTSPNRRSTEDQEAAEKWAGVAVAAQAAAAAAPQVAADWASAAGSSMPQGSQLHWLTADLEPSRTGTVGAVFRQPVPPATPTAAVSQTGPRPDARGTAALHAASASHNTG